MTYEERMKGLLAYANLAKVAAAIGVSRQTVAHWARGLDVNPRRLHQVEDLLRPQRAGEGTLTTDDALLTEMRAIRRLLQRQAKEQELTIERIVAGVGKSLEPVIAAGLAVGGPPPAGGAARRRKAADLVAAKR